ncbi:glycosyltransferase family 90 protein [Parathielavia hyrcaniae]|uniref:Glycosyltransferase family 90 protein n=1 Tax=Parathielavia hyrcaniae TaxID=113614 RepID=A0AAN6SXB3_9PEZI|nr:glycosyltransferase family 90 protein [Parathielavia hyrcaniae]
MVFPPRPSTVLRYVVPALLLAATFYSLDEPAYYLSQLGPLFLPAAWSGSAKYRPSEHPIDGLIKAAEIEFADKIAKATRTLPDAAAAYRKRRGRHPPPGFDKWYEFAQEKHNAIIVEEFWDQIYHDLEPFWAVDPARIRSDARRFEMRLEIRDHKASTRSDWFWTQIWLEMIQAIEHLLPDMDLALNAMDEPRMVVPWEDIDKKMKKAAKTRMLVDPKRVVSEFGQLPPAQWKEADEGGLPEWEHEKHYWLIARRGCAPSSPARQAPVINDFDRSPSIASSFGLEHMHAGYVANYTLSSDFCHQPDLQALEGIFVEPLTLSATKSILPLFGGSKLAVNNDILLPAPMYWKEEDRFTGAEGASIPWSSKSPTAIWRGVATGGFNRPTNWRAFQRHRFVAMNNASQLQLASSSPPLNFALPDDRYGLSALRDSSNNNNNDLAAWIASTTNISFTDLFCSRPNPDSSSSSSTTTTTPSHNAKEEADECHYVTPYFSTTHPLPLSTQFAHKYLPDIDGNSFSGRYLGFLRSTSLPVKATLWREWHDARLVAWKHFVPMDSRFGDWWGILEYFAGKDHDGAGVDEVNNKGGRDEMAERIAMDGREWARTVLRREDMLVYVLRLLLEYARVADERREVMGWVGDLM